MSSEKSMPDVGNGFILSESFHIASLPEDPGQRPTWWQVDVVAQVRPLTEMSGDDAAAQHAAILRPCVFRDVTDQSDTSDGFEGTDTPPEKMQ